jgi:hypothetical protein
MATPYSQYQPDDTFYVDESPRDKLNAYLESRDASPIRHALSTPWHEASERTKRHYLNKGWRVITTCLEELTPGQSERVLDSLAKSKFKVVDDSLDHTLLEALCECYKNANHWSTRRQVLSIMADKVSFSELKKWIPDISRYRFNIARHHQLLHGRGALPQNVKNTRMYVTPEKLEHFLAFITSTHIVQDLPFGEKVLKLSTGSELKIPNVVRSLVPEHIISQYNGYCKETGFVPASRSTLYRILNVCSTSVLKSLQGLDYLSASGAEAFDKLQDIVEKLGDSYACSKGLSWTKATNDKLKQAKRYLKSDYKVMPIG